MATDFVFKVIVVGEAGVGKSSLLRRYVGQSFTENLSNTAGQDVLVRNLSIRGKTVKLNIWDSAGQERFRASLINTFYRGAHGVFLVYDTTDLSSFVKLQEWFADVSDLTESKATKLLVGTKLDLTRSVRRSDVEAFCRLRNVAFIETSSKTGCNVEAAFDQLVTMITKEFHGETLQRHESIKLDEKSGDVGLTEKKAKKCC